jgi:hypothetical protein
MPALSVNAHPSVDPHGPCPNARPKGEFVCIEGLIWETRVWPLPENEIIDRRNTGRKCPWCARLGRV